MDEDNREQTVCFFLEKMAKKKKKKKKPKEKSVSISRV